MIRASIDKIYHKYYRRDEVYRLYEFYNKSQYWNRSQLLDYQLELFKRLWEHSIANVPYYKSIQKKLKINSNDIRSFKDLQSMPILTKDIIRKNFIDLKAMNLSPDRFIKNSTSGSTGSNLNFFKDINQIVHSTALEMRRYNWMNSNIFERELTIWGASWDIKKNIKITKLKNWIRNNKIISGYKLSDDDIVGIQNLLKNYNPKIIKSYPSILITLINSFEKNDFLYKPKIIHTGGEKLFDLQKEQIENYFKSPVYNFYGSRDIGAIAQECDHFKGLHVYMENVIVEVVDDGGLPIEEGEGNLVITSLHNFVMPFIRYKIGDRAKISKNNTCSCGRNLQLMDEIIGRTFEIIQFPNGNKVAGTFWTLVMRSVPGIKDFQIVQETPERIVIKYVLDSNYTEINIETLKNNIYPFSGNLLNLEFRKVDEIPVTKGGKMQFVITKL